MKGYLNRTLACLFTVTFVVSALLAGCSATPKPAQTTNLAPTAIVAPTSEPLKDVELTCIFRGAPSPDLQVVNESLNALVKAKINATIKYDLEAGSAYDQKIDLTLASGEPCDVFFTSTWAGNIYQNIAKGTLAPLNNLLDRYAPNVKTIVPQAFWDTVTIKGIIYAVPNFQTATAGFGFGIRKDIADKYNINWKSVKTLSDLTPILALVKEKEPTLTPWVGDMFSMGAIMFGMEPVANTLTPGWIYINDSALKVIDQYETPEFISYVHMMRDWYLKGYERPDIATLKDNSEDLRAGKQALSAGQIDLSTQDYVNAGLEYPGYMNFWNNDTQSYDMRLVDPLLTTDLAAAANLGIPVTSQNKERAMMFINLLNTDSDIYNTIVWGVKDKHYTVVIPKSANDSGWIKVIPNSGYASGNTWEFGFQGNSYLTEGKPVGGNVDNKYNKMWEDLNRNAKPASILGFVLDMVPVKTEIASCSAVMDEMYNVIANGAVDPDTYQPQLVQKLKDAGMQKILDEEQKQIDAWKASK